MMMIPRDSFNRRKVLVFDAAKGYTYTALSLHLRKIPRPTVIGKGVWQKEYIIGISRFHENVHTEKRGQKYLKNLLEAEASSKKQAFEGEIMCLQYCSGTWVKMEIQIVTQLAFVYPSFVNAFSKIILLTHLSFRSCASIERDELSRSDANEKTFTVKLRQAELRSGRK